MSAVIEPSRPLTPAQERVARLVAEGLTYGEIAAELGCAARTVPAHVEAIALRIPGDAPQRYRIRQWWPRRAA